MIEILYKPSFVKEYQKIEKSLQIEILEKIELFKEVKNHKQLKVHKLHGALRGRYSFFINYRYRIVFFYISKKVVRFLFVGDHDIYK